MKYPSFVTQCSFLNNAEYIISVIVGADCDRDIGRESGHIWKCSVHVFAVILTVAHKQARLRQYFNDIEEPANMRYLIIDI